MTEIDRGRSEMNTKLKEYWSTKLGMPIDILINKLKELERRTTLDSERLITEHPKWHPLEDARLASVTMLGYAFTQACLGMYFLREMLYDAWWTNNTLFSATLPLNERAALTAHFEPLVKHGFGTAVYARLETPFRIFLRSLDAQACRGATDAFKSVYECLLGSNHLDLGENEKKTARQLLDFIRLVRNTNHNDGVYFSKDGSDQTVIYRGQPYTFQHNTPMDFVSWKLLLTISDDARHLLVQTISHTKIARMSHVEDPRAV